MSRAVQLTLAGFQQDFPVVDGNRLVGVLTHSALLEGLTEGGADIPVLQTMRGEPDTAGPDDALDEVLSRMHRGGIRALVVVEHREIVGLLTVGNIGELLAFEAAGRPPNHRLRGRLHDDAPRSARSTSDATDPVRVHPFTGHGSGGAALLHALAMPAQSQQLRGQEDVVLRVLRSIERYTVSASDGNIAVWPTSSSTTNAGPSLVNTKRTSTTTTGVRRSREPQLAVPSTTAKDVMNLVLMTRYFDTLKEIGASSRTNAILIPHSPVNLSNLSEQMRTVMIEAQIAGSP